jgi:hypothetical protein
MYSNEKASTFWAASPDWLNLEECLLDNVDGLNGMRACLTLWSSCTGISDSDLHDPPGPNDCRGSGTRR